MPPASPTAFALTEVSAQLVRESKYVPPAMLSLSPSMGPLR